VLAPKFLAIAVLSASLLLAVSVDAASPVVEVAFSPNGGAAELVVKTIESAKASVRGYASLSNQRP
jgi:hypothetical protein